MPKLISQADVTRLMNEPSGAVCADLAARVATAFAAGRLSGKERRIAADILRLMQRSDAAVRQVIAERLKTCPTLPQDLALALAKDADEVALPILEYSRVLSDDDLAALVPRCGETKRLAIARRSNISDGLAAALIDKGERSVRATLFANASAKLSDAASRRVLGGLEAEAEADAAPAGGAGPGPAKTVKLAVSAPAPAAIAAMARDEGEDGPALRAALAARCCRGRARLVAAWRYLVALFPERQLLFGARGRVRFIALKPSVQAGLSLASVGFLGWVAFSSTYYLSFDWVLDAKSRQVMESKQAYREVNVEIDAYRARLDDITGGLEQSRRTLGELVDRTGLPRTVPASGAQDGPAPAAEESPAGTRHRHLPREWRTLARRSQDLEAGYTALETDVENLVNTHDAVVAERDRLQHRVDSLETSYANLQASQEEVLRRVTASTSGAVVEVENLLAMTGLDADRLLKRLPPVQIASADGGGADVDGDGGQGGPFIELASVQPSPDGPLEAHVAALDAQMGRLQNLQRVLHMLPLAAPLEHYRLTSTFGRRRDPIRKNRWAQHNGVDLASRGPAPILAPAPGRVVFAGWHGGFGRMVVLQHGLGIRTRYGHLRKILVKKGQRVEFGDRIALMGSSGRSTGTHLHYEVNVDGRPVDPLSFIQASRYVFQSQ